jgi:hypothetical protein
MPDAAHLLTLVLMFASDIAILHMRHSKKKSASRTGPSASHRDGHILDKLAEHLICLL